MAAIQRAGDAEVAKCIRKFTKRAARIADALAALKLPEKLAKDVAELRAMEESALFRNAVRQAWVRDRVGHVPRRHGITQGFKTKRPKARRAYCDGKLLRRVIPPTLPMSFDDLIRLLNPSMDTDMDTDTDTE